MPVTTILIYVINFQSIRLFHLDMIRVTRNRLKNSDLSLSEKLKIKIESEPKPNSDEKDLKKVKRKRVKIKFESDVDPPTKVSLLKSDWTPENWKEILENIREMRSSADAPVDSMGCDQTKDVNYSAKEQRYHTLVSLMMSSQTKDQVNHAAMCRLKDHGLTVDNILDTSDEKLGKLIYPVGFWKKKVKYIKDATVILKKEYDSDIPDTVEKLCKLPGVGPKMAYIAMTVAWKKVVGIGVDTHVHRISNRLGWVNNTSTPEATRIALEKWLPFDLWNEVNHLLVGFGQQICTPVSPKCSTCLNKEICPVGKLNDKSKKKIKKLKK